jgi:hypothetical protein
LSKSAQAFVEVDLRFGDVLAESVQPVDRVYFPTAGVVSLVVEMKVGDMIETAMVGRDGVANATAALDGKVSLHKAIVQVAGQASAIAPDSLRSLTDEFPPFRSILIRHEQVVDQCFPCGWHASEGGLHHLQPGDHPPLGRGAIRAGGVRVP